LKDEVQASLQPPIDLSDILKRLTLKDKNFKLIAYHDNEIEAFWEIIQQIDGSLTPEKRQLRIK